MPTDNEMSYPLPWVRAVLDVAILGCLTNRPAHGYDIALQLEARGLGRLKGGSLYPVLARLEEAGAVTATWVEGSGGPGRREYALTPHGRERLHADVDAWRRLLDTLDPGAAARPHRPSALARSRESSTSSEPTKGAAS